MIHTVYALKRAEVIVYIGCSGSIQRRISQHYRKDYTSWDVLKEFNDRADALAFERRLIHSLKPALNVADKTRRASVTRQALHQKRRRSLGLCAACGAVSAHYRCQACRADQRERKRKAGGFSPRADNGRGRPVVT